jgi:hypothetical protein
MADKWNGNESIAYVSCEVLYQNPILVESVNAFLSSAFALSDGTSMRSAESELCLSPTRPNSVAYRPATHLQELIVSVFESKCEGKCEIGGCDVVVVELIKRG